MSALFKLHLLMHPGIERCWQFDNSRRPGRCIALMFFLRISAIIRVVAFSVVLVFAGDIIIDSIADTREGHCVSQTSQSDSSHEKMPCSHCSCAVHSGAVVMADFTVSVSSSLDLATLLPTRTPPSPSRLAASIDHPPQLA